MAHHPATNTQSSARPTPSPRPPLHPNAQIKLIDTVAGRILCLADVRGKISTINDLVLETGAKAVIHTGDFGFFENSSLDRINDRTLRHLVQYSPLIPEQLRQKNGRLAPEVPPNIMRSILLSNPTPLLSEFSLFLSGAKRFSVPVYTVWGACEDVQVIEKIRSGEYEVENLTVLDEATTRCLDIGGVKLRLFGLGGALVMHKMFDNGEGRATIAGGQGTMWTTALQIGELVDTAQRIYDATETRLLVTHGAPGREGLLSQLALVLKADLAISACLHFRYSSSYNEFSVQTDLEAFRTKLLAGQQAFNKVWESVRHQVEAAVDDNQRVLLEKALSVVARVPAPTTAAVPGGAAAGEEPAWKNCWNWNLCDAAFGYLILDVKDGRVSAELKSHGFNYGYRRNPPPAVGSQPISTIATPAPPVHKVPPPSAPSAPPQQQQPQARASISKGQLLPTPAPSTTNAASSATVPVHAIKPVQNQLRVANGAPVQGGKKEKEAKKEAAPAKEKASGSKPATPKAPTPRPSVDTTSTTKLDSHARIQSAASPAPGVASPTPGKESGPSSPGARTPTTRRPPRNPNTLFMNKFDVPVTETEIREFFGEAKGGITFVKIPINHHTREQKGLAYIEFGDEEAMKAALAKHAEKLKDSTPRVTVAENREPPEYNGPHHPNTRGGPFRGAGRGGRGGYARNSVVAAAAAAAGPGGRVAGGPQRKDSVTNGSAHPGGEEKKEGGAAPNAKPVTPAAAPSPGPKTASPGPAGDKGGEGKKE